ncbi:MAG: DUF1285 domain-containing protein [Aliidiomarina sp.]|uniref:DUF1285 domain-containing protein n=1 Tax=Aliidiomarina sp. TaxID=1872439 RepID=UPI0025BD3F65|nr:DUF1285 domain-containing protein [Aliidiomarina sp.]MCH8501863.1 DUF1285 domain-containing protein [Aliidiomarina sp.]
MNLQQLQQQLEVQHKAPVERWNPAFCGDIDIVIKADGCWFYMGSEITRQPLVRLFASVLKQEGDEFFLVTPVEKVRIQVEDLPFLIVSWAHVPTEMAHNLIQVETNIGESYLLSQEHPLLIIHDQPAVMIRDKLYARVHRNVYYQWAEIAEEQITKEQTEYVLRSGDDVFPLSATAL